MKYYNPVLRGFHPDPSVCRVGEDFYLATSSFTYYPGVPVYHSRNLADWSLVGHCLTSDNQFQLDHRRNSKGIYAPTLRYHDGCFYMISTDVEGIGNFIVHTRDIYGSWSLPVPIDQDGIDPSLFWNDDGTCWYCGKGTLHGKKGIIGFRINPLTGERLSKKVIISQGCGGKCAEGPHIYRRDGWYYLVTAEGGTQYSHRAVIQRSRRLLSGYEPCPHNPLLSHAEQNWKQFQAIGHADMFEDQNGNWWCVCLGIRMFDDILLHNLGRETFLVPVLWQEDGWPVAGVHGEVDTVMYGPLPGVSGADASTVGNPRSVNSVLPDEWYYIRTPEMENYQRSGNCLKLQGTSVKLDDESSSPTCMLIGQREFEFQAKVCLGITESSAERFGITVYYSNYNHYDIAVCRNGSKRSLTLYKHIYDMGVQTDKVELNGHIRSIRLAVKADKKKYCFYYSLDNEYWEKLGQGTIAAFCTEAMMERSYTGTMIGLFAENGTGWFRDDFTIHYESPEWKDMPEVSHERLSE